MSTKNLNFVDNYWIEIIEYKNKKDYVLTLEFKYAYWLMSFNVDHSYINFSNVVFDLFPHSFLNWFFLSRYLKVAEPINKTSLRLFIIFHKFIYFTTVFYIIIYIILILFGYAMVEWFLDSWFKIIKKCKKKYYIVYD